MKKHSQFLFFSFYSTLKALAATVRLKSYLRRNYSRHKSKS